MDERDKIIREDYPVENLPEDLRAELGDVARVRVTLEATVPEQGVRAKKLKNWSEIKAHIERARASPDFKPVSAEEAVARVRELRDEWDR